MKRTLCLMALVLLIVSALSAGEETTSPSYSGGIDNANAKATTQVSLNIGGGDASASKIELYFLKAQDENQSATSQAPDNTKLQPSVALAFNSTPNVADNTADGSGVYAWWRVLYGGNLYIKLEIDKALSKDEETETIDWEAAATVLSPATDASEGDGLSTTTVTKTVYSKVGSGKKTETFATHVGTEGVLSFGQARIDIKTDADEDFSKIPAGTYSANLTLICTTEN